ncbi:Relaxase/Mobilisation nuclease domain-containing protein [Lachnospiraceae bacterium XBB1006]|nr:Relaxase/Mobilisation nuclease domain-containing protein [Lachnospiraceae bacterium XBB1006]
MAATRLIALHITKGSNLYKSLSDRLGYSENEKKDGQTMRALRTREIITYQIRQSFKSGEITLEKANAIGDENARRFTKGKYAFTVSTHVDKAHIHNHIIFNAISMDGKKKLRNFYFFGIALRRLPTKPFETKRRAFIA